MKTKMIIAVICMLFGITVTSAQTAGKKTDTFKVYGNCGMCKSTIEGALKKKDGIAAKKWDTKTKMISVTYDPNKITLQQIHQKIADVGYDTDLAKAKDETYNNLHECCKYERAKK